MCKKEKTNFSKYALTQCFYEHWTLSFDIAFNLFHSFKYYLSTISSHILYSISSSEHQSLSVRHPRFSLIRKLYARIKGRQFNLMELRNSVLGIGYDVTFGLLISRSGYMTQSSWLRCRLSRKPKYNSRYTCVTGATPLTY